MFTNFEISTVPGPGMLSKAYNTPFQFSIGQGEKQINHKIVQFLDRIVQQWIVLGQNYEWRIRTNSTIKPQSIGKSSKKKKLTFKMILKAQDIHSMDNRENNMYIDQQR